MLVTSIFSFSHNVFYLSKNTFDMLSANAFNLDKSGNLLFGKELKCIILLSMFWVSIMRYSIPYVRYNQSYFWKFCHFVKVLREKILYTILELLLATFIQRIIEIMSDTYLHFTKDTRRAWLHKLCIFGLC